MAKAKVVLCTVPANGERRLFDDQPETRTDDPSLMMDSSLSLAGRLVPETDLLVPSPSEERAEVEPQLALLMTLCCGLMASRTRLGGK